MFCYKDSEVGEVHLNLEDHVDEDDVRAVRVGETIHVAYLLHDDYTPGDPITDSDGQGRLETLDYRHALGLDRYGNPNFEHEYEVVKTLMYGDRDTSSSEDNDIEKAAMSLWEAKAEKGLVGTLYAEPLERRHDGVLQQCDRDEAELTWVPDKYYLENINSFPEAERMAKHKEYFESILAEYNKWASGDVWGIVQEEYDLTTQMRIGESDSCWGFIGKEYAEEERDSMIKIFTNRENNCCTT